MPKSSSSSSGLGGRHLPYKGKQRFPYTSQIKILYIAFWKVIGPLILPGVRKRKSIDPRGALGKAGIHSTLSYLVAIRSKPGPWLSWGERCLFPTEVRKGLKQGLQLTAGAERGWSRDWAGERKITVTSSVIFCFCVKMHIENTVCNWEFYFLFKME